MASTILTTSPAVTWYNDLALITACHILTAGSFPAFIPFGFLHSEHI